MSEKSWDDEDYEVPPPVKVIDDRWDGEDEEKVKDNWDDDEDTPKPAPVTSSTVPRKKTKKQIIAEKQAIKEEELRLKRLEHERMNADMTPEEKLAEKLRLQKVQEDSDLQFAVDMMGITESDTMPAVNSLSDVDLSSSAGLGALGEAVLKKIRETGVEKKSFYVPFLETFCKDLCTNLEVDEVKKVTASLNALYNDKVKANKPIKGKKKGAGKAKLHMGKESETVDNNRYIDDFDDFI